MLAGQTLSLIDYPLTARLGVQEEVGEVGEFGVQINRAFAVADTLVYLPLILVSLIGLLLRKPWALLTTAAFAGASLYWTVTIGASLMLLPGAPGYDYRPGPEIWLFVGIYLAFGVWTLLYLLLRGKRLLGGAGSRRLADLLLVD
jgi:hypothetical protein